MISGLHARPDPWSVDESDFEKAALFKWVLIPLYSYNGNPDWLAKQKALCWRYADLGLNIIYRLCSSGWHKPEDYVAEWLPVLDGLPEGPVQMDNEPNHPGENFGGSGDKVAERYNEYWLARRNLFKVARPELALGFPGLAVDGRDLEWLSACRDAITYADFLGQHIYWQEENWDAPEWGMRYIFYHAQFPEKDIYVTEYGDSTPGRSSGEKAARYRKWLDLKPERFGVKAADAFLASSPDPMWAEFELSLEDCKAINKGESMPNEFSFRFGFAALHDAHPDLIGEPTSEQVSIPNVFDFQFTSNGVLVWRPGIAPESGDCKFFAAQLLPK